MRAIRIIDHVQLMKLAILDVQYLYKYNVLGAQIGVHTAVDQQGTLILYYACRTI